MRNCIPCTGLTVDNGGDLRSFPPSSGQYTGAGPEDLPP